jgi:Uma2 family endonuclease
MRVSSRVAYYRRTSDSYPHFGEVVSAVVFLMLEWQIKLPGKIMITAIAPPIKNKTVINFPQWQVATWEDYVTYRDQPHSERVRLFFNGTHLLIDMGNEGINHSKVSDLLTLLFGFWFTFQDQQTAESLGRCLLEKHQMRAVAPDLVLYIGENIPQWQEGEPRRIDLNQWRVPDLVGEISDTTLATDLDEKKKLYADLEIPEYWVIDVKGKQVFAFRLQTDKTYQQITNSIALKDLPIVLLEETLQQLSQGTNISAANWFRNAIAQ